MGDHSNHKSGEVNERLFKSGQNQGNLNPYNSNPILVEQIIISSAVIEVMYNVCSSSTLLHCTVQLIREEVQSQHWMGLWKILFGELTPLDEIINNF